MKKILLVALIFFAMPVFANPATDAIAANKAFVACANKGGGGNCNAEYKEYDRANKEFNQDLVRSQEAKRQHEQEVIQDEQLRQQVRQRGY